MTVLQAPPAHETARRGPLRLLVRLIVLALVPVLMVASPNVAQAATIKYSGQVTTKFAADGWAWGNWLSCSVSSIYVVQGSSSLGYAQTIKNQGGDCQTGPGLDLQGAGLSLTYSGLTGAGATCSAATSVTLAQSTEGIPASQAAVSILPGAQTALCAVTKVCWDISKDSWLPGSADTQNYSGCETVSMGTPAVPDGVGAVQGCSYLKPTGAGIWTENYPADANYQGVKWWVSGDNLNRSASWYLDLWLQWPDGSKHSWGTTLTAGQFDTVYNGLKLGPNGQWALGPNINTQSWYGSQNNYTVLGFGIISTNNTYPAGRGLGYTNPALCQFYFGQRIYDDPATTQDDPAFAVNTAPQTNAAPDGSDPEPAPVTVPPPDPGQSCGAFSFTDPTTWGDGARCAMVSLLMGLADLLGHIWDAITGLPGLIVDGIDALFKPAPGYLDGKMAEQKDAWRNTAPGKWVDAVTGSVQTPGTGCGGIPVDYDLPGVPIHMNIGAACSGKMASVAGIAKTGLSALVLFGGAWMVARLILAACGVAVPASFGRGGGDGS